MKAKIDAKAFYEKLYKIIGYVTPLEIDCGKLCNGACCEVTDEITGMYLFPYENVMYADMPEWGKLYDIDFTYDGGKSVDLFTCTGQCEREKRPLSCRIFPLTPYAHRDEELKIVMDTRGKGMCPLATAMKISDLSPRFVEKVTEAMELCMHVKETREFIYALTEELDKIVL